MHLCPRATCQRFFHRSCLVKSSHVDPTLSSADSRKGKRRSAPDPELAFRRADLLLASSLPEDESHRLPHCISSRVCGVISPSLKRRSERKSINNIAARSNDDDVLAGIPEALIQVAGQPIVRGGEHGVVGNQYAVHMARMKVYDVLKGKSLGNNWPYELCGKDGWEQGEEACITRVLVADDAPALICPYCDKPI
jgi:hypothetical protein